MVERETALIYATWPDLESARKMSQILITNKLAACCNLLPGMESHYMWESEIQQSQEVVLLCKTTCVKAAEVMAAIAENHPYDTPAILQLPLDAVAEKFRHWVQSTVT